MTMHPSSTVRRRALAETVLVLDPVSVTEVLVLDPVSVTELAPACHESSSRSLRT